MTAKENIEEKLQNLGSSIGSDDKLIENVMSRIEAEPDFGNSTTKTQNIWRIIMKSPLTKFAAAAIIIIAIITGVNHFGGSISLTTIAFADMAEAMKTEPWVYIKINVLSTDAIRLAGPSEGWISFKSKINAGKMMDSRVTFENFNEHKSYNYDPNNRTITVDYMYENDFPEDFSSPVSIVEGMNRQLEAQGAKITTSLSEYKGKTALLQQTTLSSNNSNYSVNMYIQPDSKLLLYIQIKTTDSEGNSKIIGEMTFDYPKTGPADIYALGVPRDAKIINKLPSADFQAIWDNYRQKSAEATAEYIAVVTHSSHSFPDIIDMVDVDYKSGQNHRWERHSIYKTGQEIEKFWPEYKKQLGDSFDSYLSWTQAHYKDSGYISVYLYDGRYYYSTSRDDKGNWSKMDKIQTNTSSLPNETLGDIGWPFIGKTGHIIEDDYAKQNSLICIERLQQGSINQGNVSLPGRFLYYLDPKKDYLCMRKVTEWRPDADWQENIKWLDGVAPEKIRNGSITVENITETIQAPNGHWYPKTIEEKQTGIRKDYQEATLPLSSIKNIYIQTNPKFPVGIFDGAKLNRQ